VDQDVQDQVDLSMP